MNDLATWSIAGVTVVGWSVVFAFLQHRGRTDSGEADPNRMGDGDIAVQIDTLQTYD